MKLIHSSTFAITSLFALNAFAYVPSEKEQCLNNKEAVCKVNDVEFRSLQSCPSYAVTIKPLGTENCDEVKNIPAIKDDGQNKEPRKEIAGGISNNPSMGDGYVWILMSIMAVMMLMSAITLITKSVKTSRSTTLFYLTYSLVGLAVNLLATRWTFNVVFNKYNHDTFAPMMIASGAAVGCFIAMSFISLLGLHLIKFCRLKPEKDQSNIKN